ncbi:FHA domain-containing protein [Bifidobacterium sp. ESL0763]|uniref:variant leucine-rich repeat-containing protein n=1 Tax=Bifidobacterium sp. ESL0763 TaxID=2983227 RepID=UPI0023F64C3F|nr:FHA domain-containing protein [Bifidobacterium sp. ESL0763]MDF7663413.1 FHA domain-containing protein [Bifidobacterium sp. ESL0763]
MADQRTAGRWVIKVNGGVQVGVGPGEDVEIGRHPLRPLADDGHKRVEIVDATRSMSKRHALFAVGQDGSATLEDRNSTNGTYLVGQDGNLTRLAAKKPFALQTSPMRMQLGDVAVDFVKVEADDGFGDDEPGNPVTDLFDYAASHADDEPMPENMSVDDILNLRAGEPTTAFKAADVAEAAKAGQDGKRQTRDGGNDGTEAGSAVSGNAKEAESQKVVDSIALDVKPAQAAAPVEPRDLFQDALEQEAQPQQAVQSQQSAQVHQQAAQAPQTSQAGMTGDAAAAAQQATPSVSLPERHNDAERPQASQPARQPAQQPVQTTQPVQSAQPTQNQQVQAAQTAQPTQGQQAQAPINADYQPAAQAQRQDAPQGMFKPMYAQAPAGQSGQVREDAGERNRFMRPEPHNDATPQAANANAFEPAFEPGSVFEKVSKGEFDKPDQAIEVDGLNSNDAKVTTDFALQFEMAKHPELLPFLAMNPGLYDDLYAWLGSLGNQDIDSALSHNSGYDDYRQAQGTGMQA